MENLFALLIAPAMLVGVVGGVLVAMVFHWLAPAGTDTTAAGAWFVGLGAVIGLFWQWLFRKETKR